jgi:hypothetical protein
MYFKKLGTGKNFCNLDGSIHINKLHLSILTQHRFIIVHTVTFICVPHFWPVLRLSSGVSIQKSYKGTYKKILRGPLFTAAIF